MAVTKLSIRNLSNEIVKYCENQEGKLVDIDTLRKKFKLAYDEFSEIQKAFIKCNNGKCLKIEINKLINESFSSYSEDPDFFEYYFVFQIYIDSIGEKTNHLQLKEESDKIYKYFEDSYRWYDYLISLDNDILSSYEVQSFKKFSSYNSTRLVLNNLDIDEYDNLEQELEFLKKRNREAAYFETDADHEEQINSVFSSVSYDSINKNKKKNNIASLIKELENLVSEAHGRNIIFLEPLQKHHKIIQNITVNVPKLHFLNVVLDQTLRSKVITNCNDSKLVIQGNYVSLSSATNAPCYSEAKLIEIFALKKFYVDTNLIKSIQIAIIAPVWTILRPYKIILREYSESQENPAGDFLGISNLVHGSNKLTIDVNGGFLESNYLNLCSNKVQSEFSEKNANQGNLWWAESCKVEVEAIGQQYRSTISTCFLYPTNCTKDSARTGYVIFLISGQQSQFQFTNYNNERYAKRREMVPEKGCSRQKGMIKDRCIEVSVERIQLASGKVRETTVKYLRDFDMQDERTTFFDIIPTVLNSYKTYVRERFINSYTDIREPSLKDFIYKIDKNDLYNTLGFVNEFQSLEEQFYSLKQKGFSLSNLYYSLLGRVERHKLKFQIDKTLTEDDNTVLNYLCTAISSKIRYLNNRVNDYSRNLPKYLDETIDNIYEIKDLRELTIKYKFNEHYQNEIRNRIDEANDLIKNKITPEIDNIFPEIENKSESLIAETIKEIDNTKKDKKKLLETQAKLEKTLTFRYILGFTKIAGMFLSFFGPVGALIGTGIGLSVTIAESLMFDNDESKLKTVTLPAGLKYSMKKVSKQYQHDRAFFKKQLIEVNRYLSDPSVADSSRNLIEIKTNISDIIDELENEEKKATPVAKETIDRWRQYKAEMVDITGKRKDLLKNDKEKAIISHVQTLLAMGEMSFNLYITIANNYAKIENIGDAIRKADLKTEIFQQYQEIIYNTLIPMNKQIEENIKNTTFNLANLSPVGLDLVAWQIQNALQDAEIEIRKMTEGFDAQEDLIYCISKLRDGMSVMIRMYNNIQNYEETKRFVDYIANINLGKPRDAIENAVLKSSVEKLKLSIQSNLILDKYEKSMLAFENQIFPFADYYLSNINLPVFGRHNEINITVTDVIKAIKELKLNLDKYKTGRNNYLDKKYRNVKFGCDSLHIKPFFVWKYSENKRDLLKLLQGQEIILKSDVRKVHTEKNAIKFNAIGIRFVLANKNLQNDFNRELQNIEITMKHFGTSYYRCDNRFYIITTANTDTISYVFRKNCNEKPEITNIIYDDIANYDPVLSPYATWSIQLIKNVSGGKFHNFEKYYNQEIDLQLEGEGEYMDQTTNICNEKLSEYYNEDKSTSDISRVRRTANKNRLIQYVDDSLISTNDGHSNLKTSFINNFFNLIGNSFMIFKYWMPVRNMPQLYVNYKDNVNIEEKNIVNIYEMNMKQLNDQSLRQELSKISNRFGDDSESSTVENIFNTSLIYNNANILLLDLIIRRKNGIKYKQQYCINNDLDVQYAQHLAYRAYENN